jgi:hypothetical protein
MPPSKSRNSSLLTEERKEVMSTTTRTMQGVTSPAYPSLKMLLEHQERKNRKPQLQGHKGLKP